MNLSPDRGLGHLWAIYIKPLVVATFIVRIGISPILPPVSSDNHTEVVTLLVLSEVIMISEEESPPLYSIFHAPVMESVTMNKAVGV